MAKRTYAVSSDGNKTLNMIFMILIAVFMLVIPFYRGLFFRVNYIPAVILISILFAAFTAYKLKDRTYKIVDTYMDVAVLLISVSYLISFFFAVNAKDAFDMLLLYFSYFMMYKLASSLSSENEKYKNIFINVIIASTFMLSFTSMLHIAGIINLKGAFIGKRLYGLYQYANTTASVLGVGIVLALNKLINEKSSKAAAIYQMVLTALISTFIFTLSRGGYLVLAGVLLLNFLLIKARAKLKMLLYMFISFLSASVLIYKYYTLPEETISGVWIYYLIGLAASAIIVYAVSFFKSLIKLKITDKGINIILITMAVIFVGAAVFLFTAREPMEYKIEHRGPEEKSWKYKSIYLYDVEPNSSYTVEFDVKASLISRYSYGLIVRSYNNANEHSEILNRFEATGSEFTRKRYKFTTKDDTKNIALLLYNYEADSYTVYKDVIIKDSNDVLVKKIEKLKYLPADISNRIIGTNLETQEISFRIYYAKDGFNIIKDYPISGAGGGAWKNLYRQYQSIPYNTTEVHNFYVQYGTEVGIIGLAALLGLLLLFIFSMVKSIRANSKYLYVYLAVILLLIHSSIDFNLSLAAVGYILWMLIGIVNSNKNTTAPERLNQRYIGVFTLVLSLIIFIASASMYYGMKLGVQGAVTAKENKDMDRAIELYEKASKFDKYESIYKFDLAQIMNNQLRSTKNSKYLSAFIEQISLIRKYEPYNHKYTPLICSMYLSIGKLEEASLLTDVKLQNEPLLPQSYTLRIDVNYEIANYYVKNEKIQKAVPYLEKVIDTRSRLEKINSNLKEPMELTGDYPKKVEAAQRTLEMIKADIKK